MILIAKNRYRIHKFNLRHDADEIFNIRIGGKPELDEEETEEKETELDEEETEEKETESDEEGIEEELEEKEAEAADAAASR